MLRRASHAAVWPGPHLKLADHLVGQFFQGAGDALKVVTESNSGDRSAGTQILQALNIVIMRTANAGKFELHRVAADAFTFDPDVFERLARLFDSGPQITVAITGSA